MTGNGGPIVAVSMGDPKGIGPEVVVKALADPAVREAARYWVFGSDHAMRAVATAASIEPFWTVAQTAEMAPLASESVVVIDAGEPVPAATGPSAPAGALSFAYVEQAIAAARDGIAGARADAIVTAPISKEAWALAGHSEWPGHTELLAARFEAPRTRMMFVAPRLRVMLVTTHIPLAAVPSAITTDRVRETIELAHESCIAMGIARPRIAVCGLNPHAGEQGLFGDDEPRAISPAIEAARDRHIDAAGPYPGDTIFNEALAGRYDMVIAMYHDQGLIPVKLLAFDSAVNVTAGLPVPRTSPDHGTAFAIAGHNNANAGSMRAALLLAVDMMGARA